MTTRVEKNSIDCDQLGVVPGKASTPGPDPDPEVAVFGNVLGQRLDNPSAVDGHASYIAKHEAHDNFVAGRKAAIVKCSERVLERFQEEPIRRPQAHDVAECIGPGDQSSHLLWQPVVVSFRGVDGALPNVAGRLVDLPDDLARGNVPLGMVQAVIMSPQNFVHSLADIAQVCRILERSESKRNELLYG